MFILFLIAASFVIFGVINYDKISYKKFYERSEINSKHPKWTPYCGINFLKEDPQWFKENGYGEYVK